MVSATISGRQRTVAAIDAILVDLDQKLVEMLDQIIHHEDFVRLKSLWLGLDALCNETANKRGVILDILSVSIDDILYDFDEYLDLADSALFYHLYKSEYDQAGGFPYASMFLQFELANSMRDISLLRQVSMVAAACHCPVITNASPRLFGLRHFGQLEQIRDFNLLFSAQDFVKWNQMRRGEDTRYLGMALPGVKVRMRERERPPAFADHPRLEDAESAWVHAGYAFAMTLAQSFHDHGWCVYIRGPKTGGLVHGITGESWGDHGYDWTEIPLEIGFSDRQEQEMAAMGLIPLTWHRELERICIFSAPSLQKSDEHDRLAASLPYLYLVSRIAHYQKSIQRENVGAVKEADELERELETWLKSLITRMPDPSQEQRSQFPLRDGTLQVVEDPASPGFFTVKLAIMPHLQLEGVNAQLTLVSKMPRKE